MWLLKDIILVASSVLLTALSIRGIIGAWFTIQEIQNKIPRTGITWFQLGTTIFIIIIWVVVIKLLIRLHRFERASPKLNTHLLSFPLGGYSFDEKAAFPPRKGYAKIAVSNVGGLVSDCVGRITSISAVQILKGQIKILRQAFTATTLKWDSGGTKLNIPNDGTSRYLNLAYIDQNRTGVWQLAISDSQRQDYGTGRWKIEVTISSEAQDGINEKIEIALELGDRKVPPAGLNLWHWHEWFKSMQNELNQTLNETSSQNK